MGGSKVAVLLFNHELPPARRKRAFGWSVVAHGIGIVALATMAQWLPAPHIERRQSQVTPIYIPSTPPPPVEKITPPPPKIVARLTPPKIALPTPDVPRIEEKPKPVEIVKAPEPIVPKPQPRKEVVTGAFANNEVTTPVRPKKDVVTDSFASGSSAQATLQKPAREVQTGGFGDPNGVKSTSDKKGQITLARMGSFDLPAGPGNGNGTGGAHGARGTVASAGFGNGIAGPGEGDRQHAGKVVQTGFGELAAAAPVARVRTEQKPSLTPVEILYKPLPIYTQEARQMHLEGEVLVRVTFGAAGNLRVEQVVRGLGHGLDEAALRAAQQIRFRPAQRDGQPYDSSALVHIVFELAN
jgi:TonB family protein